MKTHRLGDHVSFLSGFAFKSSHFNDSGKGMPVIRIRDVTRGYSETYYSGEFSDRYVVDDGDYLIGMDGEFNLARWASGKALLNQRVCKINDVSEDIDRSYLARFLPLALKEIEDSTPFVTVKHLSVKKLNDIQIPLPPLEEQKRIAKILDAADALRAKRRESLAQLDALLQSTFLDLFGDGGVWPGVTFESIAEGGRGTFSNGPFGSDLLTSELQDSGVPVIYIRDIRDGVYSRVSGSHVTSEKAEELSACQVQPKDVLIAKVGDPPGIAAVYPENEPLGIITQDVIRIRVNKEIAEPLFIVGYLNSQYGKRKLAEITVEATRARFGLRDFKKLTFPFPPKESQESYSEIAGKVAKQKRALEVHLAELDSLFCSLQKKAFSREL